MKKVLSLILALVMAMTVLTGIALAESTEEPSEDLNKSKLADLFGGLFAEGEGEGEEADLSGLLGQLGGLFAEGEGEGEEAGLSGLLGQLGGLFAEGEGEGEETNLSGLLGQLGGLFGQEGEAVGLSGLLGELGGMFGQEGEEAELSGLLGELGGLFSQEGEEADLSGLMSMIGGLFTADEGAQEEENIFGKITKAARENVILADNIEQFYGTWVLTKVSVFGEEAPASDISENGFKLLTINEKGIFFNGEEGENTPPQLKDGILVLGEDYPVSVCLTEDGICLTLLGLMDMYFVAAK